MIYRLSSVLARGFAGMCVTGFMFVGTSARADEAVATFGSGCFWCTEADFDKAPGVLTTVSGYMGGKTKNPTYGDVGTGLTGHAEVLQVTYDTSKTTYQDLLTYYWRHVDPVDSQGQFCDRGSQYRPVIFTHTEEQQSLAEESKKQLDASGRLQAPVVVQIAVATEFTPAEDYHQNYYKTNPDAYNQYRRGCGRDARLKALWEGARGSF